MSITKLILAVSFLMTLSICAAQKSTVQNAQNEIAHNKAIWVSNDEALNTIPIHWVTNELDLVLTRKLRKIESLSSIPGKGHLSEDVDGKTLILAQPFLSCGIGHNLYKLVSETPDKLVFQAFYPEYIDGRTLTFDKKSDSKD